MDEPMGNTYCAQCGTKLEEEDPDLLPEHRRPCPECGAVARRFDETGCLAVTTVRTVAFDAILTPAVTGTGSAPIPIVHADSWSVTDHLVVAGRYLRWTQLGDKPDVVWMLQVFNEAGELIDLGMGDSQDDALLEIIESLRPPDPP